MSTKEIYSLIQAMTAADIRNELEAHGLSTIGTKSEIIQRLYDFKTSQGKRQSPPTILAPSFSLPMISSTPSSVRETYLEKEMKELKTMVTEQIARVDQREKEIEDKMSGHVEQIRKQIMLFCGSQAASQYEPEEYIEIENHKSEKKVSQPVISETVKLNRKLKMFGTSIEMIFAEIEYLVEQENTSVEVTGALHRLNNLEESYKNTVQEVLALATDEESVDARIEKWTAFQHEILCMSRKAEKYISQHRKQESRESTSVSSSVSHLRLPKFTLPEFSGEILEWISWWDEFRTCIHENDILADREKFNYLRMYTKGTAKKSIEYIEVSTDNYPRAIEVLKKRYGRKRIVVEHLVESILSIEKREKIDANSLRYLYDNMVSRYHTLESYESNLKYCHRIMVPILQSKLPQQVRKKWEFELSKIENEEEDKKITTEYFFDFLRSHVMSEEASETSRQDQFRTSSRLKPTARLPSACASNVSWSATSLLSNSRQEDSRQKNASECVFCEKPHDSSNCYMLQKKSVDERLQIIKDKKLCFNCLRPSGPSHNSVNCTRPDCLIEGCRKKHHVLLHRVYPTEINDHKSNRKSQDSTTNQVTSHTGVLTGIIEPGVEKQIRLLPTALAKIHYNGTELIVRVLLDSGSDHSYIRREVADIHNLPSDGASKSMTILMHCGKSRTMKVRNVKFQLSSLDSSSKKIDCTAWSVNTVCSPLEPIQVNLARYTHLRGLKLADKYPRGQATIDLLIGADQWGEVMLSGIKKDTTTSPVATNSIFGCNV